MDLFSITCTTCKSRLKVREESAIGQILACPKCGGMVMVNPPEGWKKGEPLPAPAPPAALPITTVVEVRRPDETLGDSNFDAVDDLLSDAPPKLRTPSSVSVAPDAPGLARPRFVGAPPPANGGAAHSLSVRAAEPVPSSAAPATGLSSTVSGEGSGTQGKFAPEQSAAPSLSPQQPSPVKLSADALKPPPPGEANSSEASPGDLPPPDWSPPRPWRYWAMMGGSVVAGIALALAVVVGMVQFFKDDPQALAQAGTTVPRPIAPATAAPSSTAASSPASAPATHPAPSVPGTPAVVVTPMPAVEPVPPTAPMPPMPAPAVEQDPLGIAEPPQPAVKPADPNDPLAKFDRLIGGDDIPATATEPGPPMPPLPDPPAVTEKPALPRPAPRTVNLTARLADPLRIETAGTPLADFLQFVQDLTTIPITLEPDGLPFVRSSSESPIVLTSDPTKDTTVGAALTAGLKPLGFEYAIVDDQLVVRLVQPAILPKRNYPVRDLAADEAQMAELAGLLQELIEPASWTASGGDGTLIVDAAQGQLVVSQRWDIHAQLMFACEKLRVARKLPHTSMRHDPTLFQLDTRLARAKSRLETPVSLNFSRPSPLVRICDYLGKAGGVRILIDWRDVAAAGWNPDGEATLIADKQPLGAALDSLLGPMDLAWRVVDGRTIQVLTPETAAARCELEFYKVDGLTTDDPSGDALLTKLRTALGEANFREAGGSGELRYDPAGQCLLASLPQPKQRELEALLAKLRSELPRP